jgi:hypothetical protein
MAESMVFIELPSLFPAAHANRPVTPMPSHRKDVRGMVDSKFPCFQWSAAFARAAP